MTRLWEEVLDLQIDTHNWLTSTAGVNFGIGWFEGGKARGENDRLLEAQDGARWALYTGSMVFNAEPITVDKDMMTVVKSAVEGFAPEPFLETDLLTDIGFLVLPEPMEVIDVRGKQVLWSAAAWARTDTGIQLCLFHDTRFPDDYPDPKIPVRLVPTHVRSWKFGETLSEVRDGAYQKALVEDGLVLGGAATIHRQLQAIWRLLNQPMAQRSSERASKPFRRRAQRAKMDHERVTVVTLRRPASLRDDGYEARTVNWTHRWLVGGHWRNQWYASLGVHRQIWISPFVKGPDDLPLVARKGRIFTLVR